MLVSAIELSEIISNLPNPNDYLSNYINADISNTRDDKYNFFATMVTFKKRRLSDSSTECQWVISI